MTIAADNLGVLGNLAIALGIFRPDGDPDPDWFGDPGASLATMLENNDQRAALVAFVDEALGGADRTSDPTGVIWLPIVELPEQHLTIAVTVDEGQTDGLHLGLGIAVDTTNPRSTTRLAIPLFRAKKQGGPNVAEPLLLGSSGGRIKIGTAVTIDESPPVPGTARLGAIGLDVDVPTAPGDPKAPMFGLLLSGFQLPGATAPRDIRVAADGLDELDDAVLDLVLSLVKAQADAVSATPALRALAGLLGLRDGDAVPDFPISALLTQGVHAIAAWLHGVLTTTSSRDAWVDYLAQLLEGDASGDTVTFELGGSAELTLRMRVDTGPSGNARLTPMLGVVLGNNDARAEAQAELFQIDLVTGAAVALPQFGVWAAAGHAGAPILNVAGPPVARANTLRVGFALDAARRLTFVLAADGVLLGEQSYTTLDLASPDAVMDAVGNTVGDIAEQLLGGTGAAEDVIRLLLGLNAPAGVAPVTLPALMSNPVEAVSGYWRNLLAAAPGAMTTVLAGLRDALADASAAGLAIRGTGTALDPWCVPLIGPLQLELAHNGDVLTVALAAATSVDTLGQRCTVVESRIAAMLAELDLAGRSASLLPGVEALLTARERGVRPARATLDLGGGALLTSGGVGLRFGWTPASGMAASVQAPDLALQIDGNVIPVTMPTIAADGRVSLPPEGWDALELLVGFLGELAGGFLGELVHALGWTTDAPRAGGFGGDATRLRLADMVGDPAATLEAWLPELLRSDLGPQALALFADLFAGAGNSRGFIEGTGHPHDPYRFATDPNLPNIAVWFPPAGLERQIVAAPDVLRRWRPGDPGLAPAALAACLAAEAGVAADLRALIDGRDLAAGLAALSQRWIGGDGRIVPPPTTPIGVFVDRVGYGAGQLLGALDFGDLIGRVPTTTVYVALGANAWPAAPAGRLVDLSTPGLAATMFAPPTPATGDWFVALGTRADCRLPASTTDGTPEQAARLARLLDALASVSSDIAVVAVAGAGHAARLAAETQSAVTDLVTLGTPLSPIALTALNTQPTADALRLLHRLLPAAEPGEPDDADLALGRALVTAMIELVDKTDPAAELRPPTVEPATSRAGLQVSAVFGVVTASQVSQAITAIVAAGLAQRARARAETPLPEPTGIHAGLRYVLPETTSGTLAVRGDALLTLFAFDQPGGVNTARHLRVRLRVNDRLGWLSATPDLELRMVSADVSVPLDGSAPGTATVTLHDARVFGQSWERLVLGDGADDLPVLPEARVLLAAAVQRITADTAGIASVALGQLLSALGIIAPGGGVAGDAVDQLIHDPGGLLRQRLVVARSEIASSLAALLGPLGTTIDLAAGTVRLQGGSETGGRFGWHADITAAPGGLSGQLRFGADAPAPARGGLQATVNLSPFAVALRWQHPGGTIDSAALWPEPEPMPLARMLAKAAPSLGGHAALELLRRTDETTRPLIDALLDALGLLRGTAGDAERTLRPLAGLLADPAGWLRSADSLAASPAKIQGLFDALRPLLGIAGAPGTPITLATGVTLAVVADGPGARLTLGVEPTLWAAPGGISGRLAAGLGATMVVGPAGPPVFGLATHVGLPGAPAGRQAIHALLGNSGIHLFVRPASGSDIALIPFAGLGALAAAAEAALPFLLDKLAESGDPVGPLVAALGDALALRSGTPRRFDADALHAWALNPSGALVAAVPTIVAELGDIVTPLADFVPDDVSISAPANVLTATVGPVSLAWNPAAGSVALVGSGVVLPGVEQISFRITISAAGLDELTATLGPAAIDAGDVELRPFVTVAAGNDMDGNRRVLVGMAVNDEARFAARWLIDTSEFALVASDGLVATAIETAEVEAVALRLVEVLADLVVAVAMAQTAVQQVLDTPIGTKTVRRVLAGVILEDVDPPAGLIDDPFDPDLLLARIHRLFVNLAEAGIAIDVDGFEIRLLEDPASNIIGLQAGLTRRYELVSGDVMLWLENDDDWIIPNPSGDGGLFVGILPNTLPLEFTPSLAVNGIGLRIGKNSGPLLDFGLSLESIALHTFARFGSGVTAAGGAQLQFTNLAVSASGAGGENGIAQGVLRDTAPTPPKPAFSPALAIQKHGNDPFAVTLRAGEGDGPWWIAIQKGFGPLYLEQVGFGASMPNGRVERVSLLMDGSVSMFGLTCAVDDLQITYITANGDFFNPNNWVVDLAGLAVSADMAGVTIAGGLLKQTTDAGIEYLGMLLGRFGVYGITIFGGYGEGIDGDQKFTAFFAVGAVNGPLGGPPAFFLTGIGGGFGINRRLRVPSDLARFGEYPLIQALDIAATPQEPMAQLRALGGYFPMQKGTFWFAAGLSFNSFALVDGIAVIAVQIGDGLDINLLGLARMALPRPQVALVSIELALLVRFSSSEGVLWVQGQLTDNSWLLYPDIKLTGGFAYVIWFKGEKRGEFVLTLGGYHPDFHRDGYPVVPRLGLRWSIGSTIVIKAGTYFALTSEALMAGGDFEASARLGPAWAEVKWGAHGIIYFDPFSYYVNAYARIAAGVTIDTWLFGEITISVSLGARIEVRGPEFRGSVTFEVGPIELTFRFGGSEKAQKQPLSAGDFIAKYLEAGDSGARAHALVTSFGALPAKGENSTPDGSAARPYVVVVEFGLTFTSTVPATSVTRVLAAATPITNHPASGTLGVAPMLQNNLQPGVRLTWQRDGVARSFPFSVTPRTFGAFPAGVWGPPQDDNNRKVPKAEMIEALNELDLAARATPSGGGPEIPYYQVEIGQRKPLPFTRRTVDVTALKTQAADVAALLPNPATVPAAFAAARTFLNASPTARASLRGERQAPPLLGTLAEGLQADAVTTVPAIGAERPAKVYDHFVDAPVAVGLLSGASIDIRTTSPARTTVKGSERAWRTAPPTMASVEAGRSRSIAARLVLVEPEAVSTGRAGTVIANVSVPPTAVAHAAPAVVARTGAAGQEPLAGFTSGLTLQQLRDRGMRAAAQRAEGTPGATLTPGQLVVLKLPNARRDAALEGDRPRLEVTGLPARVVMLGLGGEVLADRLVGGVQATGATGETTISVVQGTERIVALGQGDTRSTAFDAGLTGWHAGMQLPYVGWSSAIAPGCVVHSSGEPLQLHRERIEAGWVAGAELARGVSTVTTTFAEAPSTVVIILDDPAAFGNDVNGRQLLLGLDGASRARTGGVERPPVLLAMENRSVLAYDIVRDGNGPVVVTIASQEGWSLVGVMGATALDATGAIALIAGRGLDAALRPFATAANSGMSRLQWLGPVRSPVERRQARALASARPVEGRSE
jgi:hypothetical protein